MNSVNFNGRSNFPLSIETMTFMQAMIRHTANWTALGGDTYVLSGCETVGLNVSEGFVVINGEVLPFTGGAEQEYVYIKETKRSVIASGYNYPDVYTSRSVEFGYADVRYKWADFKRITSILELQEMITELNVAIESLRGVPKGVIAMWSGDPGGVPDGWSLCDGIDGRPNLMGRFVVGYNQTDDDYNAIGRTGGAKETALKIENTPKHQHHYTTTDDSWNTNNKSSNLGIEVQEYINGNGADGNDHSTAIFRTSPVGKENPEPIDRRPPYYVLAYIIKL